MTSTQGRHDGDSWDLSRGVGATATAVATSRALATRAGLIDDQWAEPLVKAVGMEHFLAILDGRSDEDDAGVQRMANGMAARTRYFDEFLRDCAADGIRQIVILASGLDARAYRLPWPDGTVVFDLDQDAVIDFKVATLRALAAVPTADVRNVGVDLRDDWPAALAAQGFDRQARTAWIAEGLLMYLPPDAQDRLFDHITALSPAGSRLATEFVPCMDAFAGSDDDDTAQRWRRMGFKDDLAGLVYAGERSHVIEYLQALGWAVNGVLVNELLAEYGLQLPPDDMAEKFAGFQYISAVRGPVARTDDDSWDLASSVGATATMVAAGRAMATRDPRRLIDDPFAEPLVRAVGIPFFVDMIDGRLDTSPFGDAGAERVAAMIGGMAMRTKFFDEYFIDSSAAGIRQVVVLAAGLDSRAYRLDWPSGTVVYEVDQPAVIEFKASTLSDLGATPIATLRTVGIDLREDWPTALRAAGFDPSTPTAWLAEGLLIYLPPEAQDRLLNTITELSAPGSTVATESVPGLADYDAERAREMSANLRERGLNLDMSSLIYPGPRNNVIDYLRSLGWDAAGVPGGELFRRNGLQPPDRGDYDPLGEIIYVSGSR